MRADRACATCGDPVRNGRLAEDFDVHVLLDPRPITGGRIWVDWFVDGTPYVRVAHRFDEVPGNVPLRYRRHECVDAE